MTWFKVDDKLHSHKKAARAGTAAMGLWTLAGSWCADHLSDGFVPDYIALRMDPDAEGLAERLVSAGLWAVDEQDGDRGWRFEDWSDYQPTRADVQSKREYERDKKRRQRRSTTGQFTSSPGESPSLSPGDTEGDTPGSHAVPTRPDPTPTNPTSDVPSDPDVSDEARDLTRQFALAVKDNGHAIPSAGSKARNDWLVAMDRLLRLGPPGEGGHIPDPAEVAGVIAWCAADTGSGSYPGESVTVRSVPKFRERYSELRRKAGFGTNGRSPEFVGGVRVE